MNPPAIHCEKVTLAYSSKPDRLNILEDFDLLLPSGKVHVIMGSNGCGKSTLLKLILGASTPQSGSVFVGSEADRRRLSSDWIPQDFRNALFPWKNVRDNLLPWSSQSFASTDFKRVIDLLRLGPLLDRFPSDLSGGQQQRTIIGRVLLSQPDLLVLDEPFSAMDEATKDTLMVALRQMWTIHQSTVVIALHEASAAARLADFIWLFQGPPLNLRFSIECRTMPIGLETIIRDQLILSKVE